jgi:flagellar biosynthetic protein FliQ
MSERDVLEFLREFLWTGVRMGAPLIAAALVVGVVIGLLQALTSVQETTLTFAPKFVVMLGVFWLTAGYMARLLASLFNDRVIPFVSG